MNSPSQARDFATSIALRLKETKRGNNGGKMKKLMIISGDNIYCRGDAADDRMHCPVPYHRYRPGG